MSTGRSRMRATDIGRAAVGGLRFRRTRTLLSALGIAIGIAALVSVLGITRSSESALLAEIDQLGTGLLTVTNAQSLTGGESELPGYAPAMIRRIHGVERVAPTAILTQALVYRTGRVPAADTSGLAVRAADPSLLATLGGTVRLGTFLNTATERLPVTVLGFQAAQALGISDLAAPAPPRVLIGDQWFAVAGILNSMPLAPEVDRSALVGFPVARLLGYDGHPSRIYVQTDVSQTVRVANLIGPSAAPENPGSVAVSQPSAALTSRVVVAGFSAQLYLGLGAIALLVGGIGIANVMIIAVLERRPEIGLRRALGATRRHIAAQFVAESAVLSGIGGAGGVLAGLAVTAALAHARHWTTLIPGYAPWGGFFCAILIGSVAGLYPAIRASRLPAAEALRTT